MSAEKKACIMIVDDTELNREILKSMLEDQYEILEAEDGLQAVEMLEKTAEAVSLMLLDINMPGMDGYRVLEIMNERHWIDLIPVIIISSEQASGFVKRAYDLGATDYFQRPFDMVTVSRRVRNTILLYRKYSRDLEDTVGMLSSIFYKILKVNLTEDTHQDIKVEDAEKTSETGYSPSLSQWMKEYARLGNVYPEDREEYDAFCDLEYLRGQFAKGKKLLDIHYRRKINGEFRWVSMELIPSTEYKPGNQVVLLYIRDIHDDYLRQVEFAMRRATNSLCIVTMNLTADKIVSESSVYSSHRLSSDLEKVDDFIRSIGAFLPLQDSRQQIERSFCRENLLRQMEQGNSTVTGTGWFVLGESQPSLLRLTAEIVRNSYTEEIEAVLYMADETQKYMDTKMPELLYESTYERVGIIDTQRRRISVRDAFHDETDGWKEDPGSYDEYRSRMASDVILEKDRTEFLRNSSVENLKANLDICNRYVYTVAHVEDGEAHLKSHSYVYLDRQMGIIVAAIEDVTSLSEKDTLTGGINRGGFIRRAERILRERNGVENYALLYYNIRGFKAVNELFGVAEGDRLLRSLYQNLQKSFLKPLLTARVEADQFICLVEQKNLDFDRLSRLCQHVYSLKGKQLRINGCFGIYPIRESNISVSGMCDRARLAEQHIKDGYMKYYEIYDQKMSDAYIDKTELLSMIDSALQRKEFVVYYQPVVDAGTGKTVSAEALVRWIHPQRGIISPGVFIPALEESGRISQLDLYVAKEVLEFQTKRLQAGKVVVPVSVNLSWMDFYDTSMVEWLRREMDSEIFPEGIFRYEITETSYAAVAETQKSVLQELRERGIQLLLDDFGSGYSSFSTMRNYDFDILKLDMGFVRQIEESAKTRSIIHSIIDMSHHMNVKVIAEGAETERQVQFLREHGCDYIQGYYFYKPLSQNDFEKVLN